MACRLCNRDLELRNSHIIPEAFWKNLYDNKHKALPISLKHDSLSPVQKGFREKLLCKDCECKFSKWENILKHDLIDFEKKSSSYLDIQEIKNEAIKVKNIRYKEFKLAVLSLLWRMSISSSNFYEDYNLGPYNETLRDILFNEKFVKESKFPIFVSRYELDGKFDPGLFMGFPPGRSGHFIVQIFIIWGHCFSIFVNNKMKPNNLSTEEFLRETGELYIDIRSLTELASPKSVISKIFDKNVQAFYDKKKEKS